MVRVRARRRASVDLTWANLVATGACLAQQRRVARFKVDGMLLAVAEIACPDRAGMIQALKDRRSRRSWRALRDVGDALQARDPRWICGKAS